MKTLEDKVKELLALCKKEQALYDLSGDEDHNGGDGLTPSEEEQLKEIKAQLKVLVNDPEFRKQLGLS